MNKTVATASMIASLSLGIPPRRRGSPYLDLATAHGTAAALKAEAPQPNPLRYRVGTAAYNGESDVAAALDEKDGHRIAQRAARKVRMATKRRRGW